FQTVSIPVLIQIFIYCSPRWRRYPDYYSAHATGTSCRAQAGLSYLPLIVLLRSIQPALQRSLRLRFDLQEDYAGTHIRLRINDFGLGGEERIPGGDPHEHQRSLGERIHHIQIATMEAQFAYSRSDPDVCFLIDQLSARDE